MCTSVWCHDMVRYLSVDIIYSEKQTALRNRYGNVQGKIPRHVFVPNGGYILYLFATAQFEIGEYFTRIFPSFSWRMFRPIM